MRLHKGLSSEAYAKPMIVHWPNNGTALPYFSPAKVGQRLETGRTEGRYKEKLFINNDTQNKKKMRGTKRWCGIALMAKRVQGAMADRDKSCTFAEQKAQY